MADKDDTPAGDKPYAASQRKIEDARKKGNIPRSTDLNTTAAYAGLVLVCLMWGQDVMLNFGSMMVGFFSDRVWAATEMRDGTTTALMSGQFRGIVGAILPIFAVPMVLVLVSLAGQRAFVFHAGNLEPKLSRLSFIENAKKKYGRKGLFEFFKSFLKLSLYTIALILYVATHRDRIAPSSQLEAGQIVILLGELGIGFLVVALLISGILGVLDYSFQYAEHQRSLRMTHKEVMDELKNSEGDPTLKQKRRQRGLEIASSQMLQDVADADVVIVNPEHYAVALQWARLPGTAPVVVAKGVDEIAATIREIANDNNVPIYREPPTARLLYATVEVGEEIEPDHYQAVAAAIRFAEAMRLKRRRRHDEA